MSAVASTKYRLLADYGNQGYDPVGGVRHGLKAGAIGTKVLEVPAAEAGAHNNFEDSYVLEFDDESRSIGEDGEVKITPATRRISFATSLFGASYVNAEQYGDHVARLAALATPVSHTGPLFEEVAE
jgi:hypothetical protein